MPSGDNLPGGSETVLLVEDDAALRNGAVEVLRSCGYRVLSAGDGDEALQISEQYHEPIHLLLTDVVMPHLAGPELARRLQAQRPETQVLFMSGYANNMLTHSVLSQHAAFLPKPFTLEGLTHKVRAVLDQG